MDSFHHSHAGLVRLASQWLRTRCPVIITEIATTGEEPDAIGFGGPHDSVLIECKASRADFLRDKKKHFRQLPENGLGALRYYLAPEGIITKEDLPDRWGLLVPTNVPRTLKTIVKPILQTRNIAAEQRILISAFRRLGNEIGKQTEAIGMSIKFYTMPTTNRATLGIEYGD